MIAAFLFAALSWVSTIQSVQPAVVRLSLSGGYVCSAVIIKTFDGMATALSAAHCFEDEATTAQTGGQDVTKIRVDPAKDLALIRFRVDPSVAPLDLGRTPALAADIAIIGYALGSDSPVVTIGHVSRTGDELLWADAMSLGGDSGGAVIDEKGRLVGILSGSEFDGRIGHIARVIAISTVRDFLKAKK